MPERFETFKAYDEAISALIAYDEQHDPHRAGLLRDMFTAQRVFFHSLIEGVMTNSQAVSSLADRVQNHISPQLIDILDAGAQAGRAHQAMLDLLQGLAAQQGAILAAIREAQDREREAGGE